MNIHERIETLKNERFFDDYSQELSRFKGPDLKYRLRDMSKDPDIIIKPRFDKSDIQFGWHPNFQKNNDGYIEIPCFYPEVIQPGTKNKILDYKVNPVGNRVWEIIQKNGFRGLNPGDRFHLKDFTKNTSFYLRFDEKEEVFKLLTDDELDKYQKELDKKASEDHIGLLKYYVDTYLYPSLFDGPNVNTELFEDEKQIILNYLYIHYYLSNTFTESHFHFLVDQIHKTSTDEHDRKQIRLNILLGRSFYLVEGTTVPSLGEFFESEKPGTTKFRKPSEYRLFHQFVHEKLLEKEKNSPNTLTYLSNDSNLHSRFDTWKKDLRK